MLSETNKHTNPFFPINIKNDDDLFDCCVGFSFWDLWSDDGDDEK